MLTATAIAAALAVVSPAAAHTGLHITLTVPQQATAGTAISFSYTSLGVPNKALLVVQRQMGTAKVYRTVATLKHVSRGKGVLPALPIGAYTLRIAVLTAGRTIPDPPAFVHVYGAVSLATLCNNTKVTVNQNYPCASGSGTTQIGGSVFSYVAFGGSYGDTYPTFHDSIDFPATTCRSIQLMFGLPNDAAQSGDAAYLEVVSETLDPQAASAPYGSVGTLNAELDGRPWDLDNSSSNGEDPVAANGSASCYTPTGY